MGDHHDAVARADPQHGVEADQRAQRDDAQPGVGRQHATDQRAGQGHEHQRGQAEAAETGLEQQQDGQPGERREHQQAVACRLTLGGLADQLGPVAQRELDGGQPVTHLPGHRAQIAPADVGDDIDPPRAVLAPDHVRGGRDPDAGHLAQPHRPPAGRVDGQVADIVEAGPRGRRAPYRHVVCPAAAVDVAHLLLRQQRARGPPDVAGLEPIGRGGGQVGSHVDLRYVLGLLGAQVDQTSDRSQCALHLPGLAPQRVEGGAVHAYRDRLVGPAEVLVDPLTQVGLDVAVQAGTRVGHGQPHPIAPIAVLDTLRRPASGTRRRHDTRVAKKPDSAAQGIRRAFCLARWP